MESYKIVVSQNKLEHVFLRHIMRFSLFVPVLNSEDGMNYELSAYLTDGSRIALGRFESAEQLNKAVNYIESKRYEANTTIIYVPDQNDIKAAI